MARLGKVRVLVVDDNMQRVEVFQRCLGAEFDIVQTTPGDAATRLLETEDFDVLISEQGLSSLTTKKAAGVVGSSALTRDLLVAIETIARKDGDVLLVGEAGSGKALVARSIHQAEGRSGAFICLRLQELEAGDIESTIFERSMPEGGTLFLDGIERLPAALQERLVRERQSGQLPATRCRVICACAPKQEKEGISPELAKHLSPLRIGISPLRDRGEDIPRLAVHFVARAAERVGRGGVHLSRAAMAELCAHDWPGNVSELRKAIEQAVSECGDSDEIGAGLLEGHSNGQSPVVDQVVDNIIGGCRGLDAAMAELEAAVIREALQQQRGNRSAAARQLKLPRQTLQDRMKKHGLWSS